MDGDGAMAMLWSIGSLRNLAAVGLASVILAAGHAGKAYGHPQIGGELEP